MGYGDDFGGHLWHLFLPALTIALFLVPILVQSLRASMLDVMTADYIEVARSKGLSPMRIMFKHVLRNALIPVITILSVNIGWLLSGIVIVEFVFSIPGMGSLLVRSAGFRDLSGHPGACRRLHADCDDRQPACRSQLHAGRPPGCATMRVSLTVPRGTSDALRGEFRRWPMTMRIGVGIIGVLVFAGIFAPYVAPYDPYHQDYGAVLLPPSWAHPFGTDMAGRDILSRVIYGIRIDMQVGFVLTYVPMVYGVVLGALAGYFGGAFDAVMMRILDTALAFPFLVLVIVIVAVIGPGLPGVYLAVFLLAWTLYARLARAEMLVERKKDYMLAAATLGYPTSRIIFRHALPNIITSSIVFSMADYVLNILLLASLSFLGLGVQPPDPEWGSMIAEARDYIFDAWWICTLPGLVIVLAGHRSQSHRRRLGKSPRSAAPGDDLMADADPALLRIGRAGHRVPLGFRHHPGQRRYPAHAEKQQDSRHRR